MTGFLSITKFGNCPVLVASCRCVASWMMSPRRGLTGSKRSLHFTAARSVLTVFCSSSRSRLVTVLGEKTNYFGMFPLDAQYGILNQLLSPVASVTEEGHASLVAAKEGDIADAEDGDMSVENAVCLDDMEHDDAKCRQHLNQYGCRKRKYEVLGSISEAFEMLTDLANQDVPPDAGFSTESASIKNVLGTAHSEAENGQE